MSYTHLDTLVHASTSHPSNSVGESYALHAVCLLIHEIGVLVTVCVLEVGIEIIGLLLVCIWYGMILRI